MTTIVSLPIVHICRLKLQTIDSMKPKMTAYVSSDGCHLRRISYY